MTDTDWTDAEWPLRDEERATFLALDRPTRHLVLRLLGHPTRPTAADWDELGPQAQILVTWLRTHPAYRDVVEDDEDDEAWVAAMTGDYGGTRWNYGGAR